MSDKPLEDRLEEESKYSLEDQEYDGALSYHLPSKKDLTNYYPPSTGNVQGMEKAILHTVGEVPSNWVMSLTPEQQKELSDLSPEIIEHLPRVYEYYETATNVTKDIEDTWDKLKFLAKKGGKWIKGLREETPEVSTYGMAHFVGELLGPQEGAGPSLRFNLGSREELGINPEQFNRLLTLDQYEERESHRINPSNIKMDDRRIAAR